MADNIDSTQQSGAYVVRFGFNLRSVGAVLGSTVFTVALIVLPGLPILLRLAGLLLFGAGGLYYLFTIVKGGVAFQADDQGITLGNPPLRRQERELRVPWESLAEVVLFRQYIDSNTMPYVGLRLRPGAPAPGATVDRDSMMRKVAHGLVPHVPEDVLAHSRPINGWRLDEQRLAQTLAAYAPHVRVVQA